MLPDMLVGMFTGKSRNLKFGDNMMPIAAIFAGMFVKNPLLKMMLVGLGGANLLNKAGHEALLNEDAVDAYYQGVLPLNTLANAVLRKYDDQQRSIQENFERQMKVEERQEKMIAIK